MPKEPGEPQEKQPEIVYQIYDPKNAKNSVRVIELPGDSPRYEVEMHIEGTDEMDYIPPLRTIKENLEEAKKSADELLADVENWRTEKYN